MMSTRYLTKSRFKTATQCPTKLFYSGKPEYANKLDDNDFLQSLAEGGFQVGELAKLMFPGSDEVKVEGHEAQVAQTKQFLATGDATVFEAALAHEKLFVRVDVLKQVGESIELIEVKSKTYDKNDPHYFRRKDGKLNSELLPYLLDVAFQTHVARYALPGKNIRSYLMLIDKNQPATVDGLNQKFVVSSIQGKAGNRKGVTCEPRGGLTLAEVGTPILTKIDVQEYVDEILSTVHTFHGVTGTVAELGTFWAEAYAQDKKITPSIGTQCKQCEFRAPADSMLKSGLTECWAQRLDLTEAQLKEPLVIDLWDGRRVKKWLEDRTYLMRDLTREQIGFMGDEQGISRTQRQWMAISEEGLNTQGYYFDAALAAKEMSEWKYPLNLIDFETSTTVLPFHKDARPLELIAFQFSHHVLYEDGSLIHANEFLSTAPGERPNIEFLRALKAALSQNEGSVMMWSSYENTVLNKITDQIEFSEDKAKDSDDLVAFAKSLTIKTENKKVVRYGVRKMFDLCKLSEKAFFHRYTKGSSSIKKVLPAMLQASESLKLIYSEPNYGGGLPNSKNFSPAIAWWQAGEDGLPIDPYKLLPPVFNDLDLTDDEHEGRADEDLSTVNQGGAAIIAYARLQFETISIADRASWETALKKYCELDTLAMAMIVQGWVDWISVKN